MTCLTCVWQECSLNMIFKRTDLKLMLWRKPEMKRNSCRANCLFHFLLLNIKNRELEQIMVGFRNLDLCSAWPVGSVQCREVHSEFSRASALLRWQPPSIVQRHFHFHSPAFWDLQSATIELILVNFVEHCTDRMLIGPSLYLQFWGRIFTG